MFHFEYSWSKTYKMLNTPTLKLTLIQTIHFYLRPTRNKKNNSILLPHQQITTPNIRIVESPDHLETAIIFGENT